MKILDVSGYPLSDSFAGKIGDKTNTDFPVAASIST